MATITCTPGGASDNSYIKLTDADAYFADGLRHESWTAHTSDKRTRALIDATADIERLGGSRDTLSPSRARFPGTPYDLSTPQALHFPRTTDVDDAGAVVIPEAVQRAVCEQALWLLERASSPPLIDRHELRAEGVRSLAVDGISETYVDTGLPRGIAPAAWEYIRPYVAVASRTRTGNLGKAYAPRFRATPD